MTTRPRSRLVITTAVTMFRSPRLTSALATVGIGAAALAFAAPRVIGLAGYAAGLATLLVLMTISVVVRRSELEVRSLLPITLMAFLAWCALSLIWSGDRSATASGLLALGSFTAVGIYVAISRDTIQVVRTFGDVIRAVLGVSLVLEVFSGILIDSPIAFLRIDGDLASLGPISGIMGTRSDLGLLAIIGTVTFVIEARTRSVSRGLAVGSIAMAMIVMALTRSPVVVAVALIVAATAAVLWGIRHIAPRQRQWLQLAALGAAAAVAIGASFFGGALIRRLNVAGELDYRIELWRQVLGLIRLNDLEGFGWVGPWPTESPPYILVRAIPERPATSALNAFLDAWLQVGLIGLVLLALLLGFAFARSWLLAGRRRSVTFAWPAGVMAALVASSFAESWLLADIGWVTLVICSVKASQELSWRNALRPADAPAPQLAPRAPES